MAVTSINMASNSQCSTGNESGVSSISVGQENSAPPSLQQVQMNAASPILSGTQRLSPENQPNITSSSQDQDQNETHRSRTVSCPNQSTPNSHFHVNHSINFLKNGHPSSTSSGNNHLVHQNLAGPSTVPDNHNHGFSVVPAGAVANQNIFQPYGPFTSDPNSSDELFRQIATFFAAQRSVLQQKCELALQVEKYKEGYNQMKAKCEEKIEELCQSFLGEIEQLKSEHQRAIKDLESKNRDLEHKLRLSEFRTSFDHENS